jgi:hypothetical protein
MRRILVESARRKRALKHGGGLVRRELDEAALMAPEPCEDLLALDEALTKLATTDRTAAELVKLRYFGGWSVADAAQILRVSTRTANRTWTYARAWLRREMEEEPVALRKIRPREQGAHDRHARHSTDRNASWSVDCPGVAVGATMARRAGGGPHRCCGGDICLC